MSSVTTREPEFTPEERAKFLAYLAYKDGIGQYGEVIEEAMSDDANGAVDRNAKYHYEASYRVNHAAAAVEREQALLQKTYPDDPMHGFRWSVQRVEGINYVPRQ